ncbi:uncharacterized protein LOC130677065 [Microplitis mediator]|uniref:uncharacterized protein LOC130677065 n=1 Tax=Microplitis mediator TaxID=375433 RepID=UPI0025535808|nr:uncharacterized protein LOC130677065 [Microplitis mediator]
MSITRIDSSCVISPKDWNNRGIYKYVGTVKIKPYTSTAFNCICITCSDSSKMLRALLIFAIIAIFGFVATEASCISMGRPGQWGECCRNYYVDENGFCQHV